MDGLVLLCFRDEDVLYLLYASGGLFAHLDVDQMPPFPPFLAMHACDALTTSLSMWGVVPVVRGLLPPRQLSFNHNLYIEEFRFLFLPEGKPVAVVGKTVCGAFKLHLLVRRLVAGSMS